MQKLAQAGPRAKPETHDALGWAYYEALGLSEAGGHYVKSIWTHGGPETWRWSSRLGRACPPRASWCYEPSPISPWTAGAALFDGASLAPSRLATTRIVVLDVDPLPCGVTSLAEHLRSGPVARRMLAAKRCGERVRALRERWGELPWYVEQTGGRGYHLVLRLARSVGVERAHAIGTALLAGLGLEKVEVFPRPEGGGDRWCALPCTGRSRAVEADLVTLVGRSRAADAAAFLATETIDPDELPGECGAEPSGPRGPLPVAPLPVAPPPATGREDGPRGLPQTRGIAFKKQIREVLTRVRDDCSRWAVAKLVACCFYLAVGAGEARRAFDTWVTMPGHEADHFRTRDGRGRLRALFRNAWKRYEKGVRDGSVEVGRMKAPDIRGRISLLAAMGDEEVARAA